MTHSNIASYDMYINIKKRFKNILLYEIILYGMIFYDLECYSII